MINYLWVNMIIYTIGIKIDKSDLQIGLYVHCEDFGRGKIVKLYSDNLMSVHFDNHKLPCMCSQDGYTVFDNKKRKITRL